MLKATEQLTDLEMNLQLLAPESEFKRIIGEAIGAIVEKMQSIEEMFEQFFKKKEKEEEIEMAELDEAAEDELSKIPDDFAKERKKQLEELEQIEQKINQTYKDYLALKQQFDALNSVHPGLLDHAKFQQRREEQAKADLYAALNHMLPKGWDTPEKRQQIEEQFKERVASKGTVLEAEAVYMSSVAKHDGETINPKERKTLQIALKHDMLQEIRLRAVLFDLLTENDPKLTSTEKKAKINEFFKSYLNTEDALKKAQELEKIYSHENAEKMAGQLGGERGIAYLRAARDEIVNLDNKMQTQEKLLTALFVEYNKVKTGSTKEVEVKKNLTDVLVLTSEMISNPKKQEDALGKWQLPSSDIVSKGIKGFAEWGLSVIETYRALTGEKYREPNDDVPQSPVDKAENYLRLVSKDADHQIRISDRERIERKSQQDRSLESPSSERTSSRNNLGYK